MSLLILGIESSCDETGVALDRKSTRLNSSHLVISYAVFCLKKKKKDSHHSRPYMKRKSEIVSNHAQLLQYDRTQRTPDPCCFALTPTVEPSIGCVVDTTLQR